MKNRGVTPSSSAGYIPGGNWCMCDICGFRFRSFDMRTQPHGPNMGLLVCPKDYDRKNPQWDEIEAVEERIVPNIVNIEPDIVYVNSVYSDGGIELAVSSDDLLGLVDGSQLLTASADTTLDRVTADDL